MLTLQVQPPRTGKVLDELLRSLRRSRGTIPRVRSPGLDGRSAGQGKPERNRAASCFWLEPGYFPGLHSQPAAWERTLEECAGRMRPRLTRHQGHILAGACRAEDKIELLTPFVEEGIFQTEADQSNGSGDEGSAGNKSK